MTCKHNTQNINGELICKRCGVVLGEEIIPSDFDQNTEADSNVAGGKPVYPNRIPLGYIYSRQEREYLDGRDDIELFCSRYNSPQIIRHDALNIWKQCVELKLSTGRNRKKVLESCFYLTGLLHGREYENLNTKYAHIIKNILSLSVVLPNSVSDELVKFAKKLEYPQQIIQEAVLIFNSVQLQKKGKTATCLGILYYLNKQHNLGLRLLEICRVGNITLQSVKTISQHVEEKYGKD